MSDVTIRSIYGYSSKSCRRIGVNGDFNGAAFNIFNVANSAIIVRALFGHVTTIIAGAAVPRLQFTPQYGVGGGVGVITPICAAAATINTDAVGTVYNFPLGTIAAQLAPAATIGMAATDETGWGGSYIILVPGIISVTGAVAATGVVDWYISYQPCAPDAIVTAL